MQVHNDDIENAENASSWNVSETSSEYGRAVPKWMSIRVVLGLLCVVTAIGLFGTSIFSVTTCKDALDTTNNAGDAAFDACMANAEKTSDDLVLQQLNLFSIYIHSTIDALLKAYALEVSRFAVAVTFASTSSAPDWAWVKQQQDDLVIPLLLLGSSGLNDVEFFVDDKYVFSASMWSGSLVFTTNDGSGTPGNNATHSTEYAVDRSFALIPGTEIIRPFSPGKDNELMTDFNHNVTKQFERTWGPLRIFHDRINLVLRYHFVYAPTGAPMSLFMGFSPESITVFLSGLFLNTSNSRVYVVVGDSPMANKYEAIGETALAASQNDTGLLVGVSHGAFFSNDNQLRRDVDADDAKMALIAERVHELGGYAAIADTEEQSIKTTVNGSLHHLIVKVYEPTRTVGVLWYVVGGIPTRELLEESLAASADVFASRTKAKSDSSDKVDRNLATILILSGCIALALTMSSTAVSLLITNPVRVLQREMKRVSEMDLKGSKDQKMSLLYEVSEIQKSFFKMVSNLEEFRAYVPSALLNSGSVLCVLPPEGEVALVFTDIVGSTSLWSKAPVQMDAALETHNRVMREWCQKEEGYEVKTIGDAFMIAFSSAVSAVRFCCGVQEDLLVEEWPEELELPMKHGTKNPSQVLWGGIRVRMGCHFGTAILEENPLTGRSDYRGTTVNTASRVEGKALAGTICVTDELLAEVRYMVSTQQVTSADHRMHDLKGLGSMHLNLLVPPALVERLDESTAQKYEMTMSSPEPNPLSSAGSSRSSIDGAGRVKGTVGAGGRRRKGPKKTQLSLVREVGTVAVCKLLPVKDDKVFDCCNLMIRAVCEVASQTDGNVGGVCGEMITVAWNTVKPNKLHTTAAMRFTSELQRRAGAVLRVGLGTGQLLHGNVGTKSNRYHNIFSVALQAAEAAASHTSTFNTFAVLADCTDDGCAASNPSIASFVRIVDSWLDVSSKKVMRFYELNTTKLLTDLEDAWAVADESVEDQSYKKAYYSALQGDEEALDSLQTFAGEPGFSTDVVTAVHKLLKNDNGLRNGSYRTRVTIGGLPLGAMGQVEEDE